MAGGLEEAVGVWRSATVGPGRICDITKFVDVGNRWPRVAWQLLKHIIDTGVVGDKLLLGEGIKLNHPGIPSLAGLGVVDNLQDVIAFFARGDVDLVKEGAEMILR